MQKTFQSESERMAPASMKAKPFTLRELSFWLAELGQKEWNPLMTTHHYKTLRMWRIVRTKPHPLKPNGTWSDEKAARARPLMRVADVPQVE